ncbi:MAG: FAD-dependent oxidoreductase [Zoogloeaceae bacterium]|uniref:FAD-dependent oxidoreductase n=1 Tax=Denitromonas sp. TaxID=2734609 RepID=UPI001DC47F9F|nr:FAD-dependent oxidoreductase [Rhodocyclaceae bacterium]MCP5221391.1 FAD-dependent oxidoreductase [Zoogloeaceae bacterium]
MKKWLCIICGLIYDEAQGWPKDGIVAGTRWEDVPEDWKCPDCGVGKADFEMIEITAPATAVAQPVLATVPAIAPKPALPQGPIVIIGSGHAGYALAAAVRAQSPQTEIVMLTRESGHRYSKPALSVASSQRRNANDLIDESPFEAEQRLRMRIYPHCEVRSIDPATHTVHTGYGAMPYGQLVLALGASPIRLDIAGRTDALLSINNLDDYAALQSQLRGASRVAIIGDGLIGCEFANDLAAAGYGVSVVGIGRWPLERLLPEAAGHHLQQALTTQGVDWHLRTSVVTIDGEPGAWHLHLADGQTLEVAAVISAVGLAPNVDLAASCGAEVGRGIRTDAQLRTSQPDIYALGDCIEIDGRPAPYLAPINHGIEALARTLTGQPTAVHYPPMPVQVKTPAAPLSLLPAPAGIPGEWRTTPTDDGLCCTYHDDTGRMRGFALIGQAAQSQRRGWVHECSLQVTQEAA